jgi:hypothetical protein
MTMTRRASVPRTLAFALMSSLIGGGAWAQTRACPPCGPTEHCVDGACLPNPDAPPAVPAAPPIEAPPPAAATPEPAAPPEAGVEAKPAPARRRKAHAEAKARETEDEEDAVSPASPSWRKGMIVIPFGGLHAVEGIAANDYDAGLRLGFLLGTHLAVPISLNVEVAMDFLSPTQPGNTNRSQISGHDLTVAFSPLFHGSAGIGELVIGPKLGYWSSGITTSNPGFDATQFSQTGWAFGFNMGAFAGVSDAVALGAILTYQMTFLSQECVRGSQVPVQGCTGSGFAPQILGFSVGALF